MYAPLQLTKDKNRVAFSSITTFKRKKALSDVDGNLFSKHNVLQTHSTRSTQSIVQRRVLNLDSSDPTSVEASKIAANRERAVGRSPGVIMTDDDIQALLTMGKGEELTIIAHGSPMFGKDEPTVAGKTAQELFDYLVHTGLRVEHTGVINLSACTTAWARWGEKSFAERLRDILQKNGRTNKVTGFRSFVESLDVDTEVESAYDERETRLALAHFGRYTMAFMKLVDREETEDEKNEVVQSLVKSAQNHIREVSKAGSSIERVSQIPQEVQDYHLAIGQLLMSFKRRYNENDTPSKKAAFSGGVYEEMRVIHHTLRNQAFGGKDESPKVTALPVTFDNR
ncbi:hypothetical protein [uncultured Shewanella sp.]|uniref:hypothetical protein n=1 Tax=uncultured Shewanella sp. TaxID=173975 RepID=UPI002620775C|nr:hypothetical protein [uncultured Shewanella sp.]